MSADKRQHAFYGQILGGAPLLIEYIERFGGMGARYVDRAVHFKDYPRASERRAAVVKAAGAPLDAVYDYSRI